ncbi:MAG TPA: XRE family transcriptional regulator [Candidatus Binataceae bacterium]|nr:XRE family transcriptional regulator [Candidatus Binataceae bacterium]
MIDSAASELGERLGRLRSGRGWTLAELANRSGLSKPYLSRLESGVRQPSLGALLTLARVYETPLQSLVDTGAHQQSSPVVIRGSKANIQRGNGLRYRAISSGGALQNLSAVHVTVPRRRRQTKLSQHEGEELLYVLSGKLNLVFDNESHALLPGDAAHFDAHLPHRLNASGETDAEVLLVAYVPNRGKGDGAGGTTHTQSRRKASDRRVKQELLTTIAICSSLDDAHEEAPRA